MRLRRLMSTAHASAPAQGFELPQAVSRGQGLPVWGSSVWDAVSGAGLGLRSAAVIL